jgi:hypothetical protein
MANTIFLAYLYEIDIISLGAVLDSGNRQFS